MFGPDFQDDPASPFATTSLPTIPPRLFPLSSRILPRSSCSSRCRSEILRSSAFRNQRMAPWCAASMDDFWCGVSESGEVSDCREGRNCDIKDAVVDVVGAFDCRTTHGISAHTLHPNHQNLHFSLRSNNSTRSRHVLIINLARTSTSSFSRSPRYFARSKYRSRARSGSFSGEAVKGGCCRARDGRGGEVER